MDSTRRWQRWLKLTECPKEIKVECRNSLPQKKHFLTEIDCAVPQNGKKWFFICPPLARNTGQMESRWSAVVAKVNPEKRHNCVRSSQQQRRSNIDITLKVTKMEWTSYFKNGKIYRCTKWWKAHHDPPRKTYPKMKIMVATPALNKPIRTTSC